MRTVTVRMRASDLAHQMAAMHEWLDRHRYEPARFVCDQQGDAVDVSVEFPDDQEGEAFASRFDGQDPPRPLKSRGIDHVEIVTDQLDRTVQFYPKC